MGYHNETPAQRSEFPYISKDVFDKLYLRLYGRLRHVMEDDIGAIKMFLSTEVPINYAIADGRLVSRYKPIPDFPANTKTPFFEIVGERFGTGDGSTTFQVPDFRDEFIRMNVQDGREPGDNQVQQVGEHQHATPISESSTNKIAIANQADDDFNNMFGTTDGSKIGMTGGLSEIINGGGKTNTYNKLANTTGVVPSQIGESDLRPKNVYMVAAVKISPEGYDTNWNLVSEALTWKEVEELGIVAVDESVIDAKDQAVKDLLRADFTQDFNEIWSELDDHVNDLDNPHAVDKVDVGLSNVANLTATASIDDDSTTKYLLAKAAYDLKAMINAHNVLRNNPHGVTALQVGLGNVNNWVATSSLTDGSSTKYATAAATKALKDTLNSVSAVANAALPKTGGTISSNLTVSGVLTANGSIRLPSSGHIRFANDDYITYDDVGNTYKFSKDGSTSGNANIQCQQIILGGHILKVT